MSSILEALEKADEARGLDPNRGQVTVTSKPGQRRMNPSLLLFALVLILLLSVVVWLLLIRNDSTPEKPAEQATESAAAIEQPVQMPSQAEPVVEQLKQRTSVSVPEQLKRTTLPSSKPLIEEAVVNRPNPLARAAVSSVDLPPAQADQQTDQVAVSAEDADRPAARKAAETAGTDSLPKRLQALPLQAKQKLPAVVRAQLGEAVESDGTAAAEVEQIPLVWELPQRLREKVLRMQSSIHVYSEIPAQRFVIINMKRYQEGDELPAEGLRLKRIEREGMVIDYGGGLVRLQGR